MHNSNSPRTLKNATHTKNTYRNSILGWITAWVRGQISTRKLYFHTYTAFSLRQVENAYRHLHSHLFAHISSNLQWIRAEIPTNREKYAQISLFCTNNSISWCISSQMQVFHYTCTYFQHEQRNQLQDSEIAYEYQICLVIVQKQLHMCAEQCISSVLQ